MNIERKSVTLEVLKFEQSIAWSAQHPAKRLPMEVTFLVSSPATLAV